MKRILYTLAFLLLFIETLYSRLLIDEYKKRVKASRPSYNIEVNLDYENKRYDGIAKITFEYPFKKSRGVFLRLFANSGTESQRNITIKSIWMDGKELKFSYINNTTVEVSGEYRSGKRYTLSVEFNAILPEIAEEDSDILISSLKGLLGLGGDRTTENNYGIYGCSSSVCNIAAPFPSLAKAGENDWNISDINGMGDYQRGDFSDYNVVITCDESLFIVSNGIITNSERLKNAKVRHTIVADAVNDIVLEASRSFRSEKREINNILYLSYYTSEEEEDLARRSITIASEAIEFFSKYYARYPYNQFKIVSAPMTGGAGGVEFPGLITIGDFLYKELKGKGETDRLISPDLFSEMFEFVIAHEVAHQWFSTLIPSDSRKEPYLDEGLASFSAYLYLINKYGEEEGKRFLDNQIRLNYQLMRLLGYKDLPLNTPIENYEGMLQYAGIIYGKAPLFFIKLREIIGEKRFSTLLSNWVKERAFKDTGISNLIDYIKSNDPSKAAIIESTYRRWFEETYGDEDIGNLTLKDLLKYINNGEDVDLDINLERFREWLENTFDMFRQYR